LRKFADKYGIPADFKTCSYEDVTYRISGNDLCVVIGSDGPGRPRALKKDG
jgi:hypothetical protein